MAFPRRRPQPPAPAQARHSPAPRFPVSGFLLLALPFFLGCANRALVRYDKVARQAEAGEFLAAAERIRKDRSSLYGSQSELLYHMDLGLLYHYAGRYDSSKVFLARAMQVHEDLYARSVTQEAASLLTNDNIRPYRGRPYEIAWLHLFQAFNYLATGEWDGARVEVRKAQLHLEAVRAKAGSGASAYRDDGLFRTVASLIYEALGEKDDALISLYHGVKAYREAKQPVPAGLARHAYAAFLANGRENDVQTLELSPPAEGTPAPELGASEIVVVGCLGRSPALGETVFWGTWVRDGVLVFHYRDADGNTVTDALPAPGLPPSEYRKAGGKTRSGTTLHLKWAMPSLREIPSHSRTLRVSPNGGAVTGEVYADTRDLLTRDLAANRAATLARTVTRVVARTLASQKTKSSLNTDNPLLNLLLNIGIDVLGDQLEQADTRLWFLLPRSMHIARLPAAPGKHTLTLGAAGADGRLLRTETREVEVLPGRKTFVFFNSLK